MSFLRKVNHDIFYHGGAGFIGSNLVDRLLAKGHEVLVYDNFSTGLDEFIVDAKESPEFSLIKDNNLNLVGLTKAMKGADFIFHFAANANVRFGIKEV